MPTPPDLPTLHDLLTNQGWTDLGAAAGTWGQPACVPTCITKQSHAATRRDYMFCNPTALSLVRGLYVRAGDLCPTHSTVEVHLALDAPAYALNKQRTISPLDGLVQHAFHHLYGEPPAQPSADDLLLRCWANAHPDDAIPSPELFNMFTDDYRYLFYVYEHKYSDFIDKQRQHLDAHLQLAAPTLQHALHCGDLDSFWEVYWSSIELAATTALNMQRLGEANPPSRR